ncbi:hypothetical protein SEPCBS119000_004844 [Sporothrix epigloea]|uniref:Phospholipid/glycerol acyltransferase domain-containing protein n=1 Tax=Sporothrix epigloea TaxID=1892477 RepID=A0ABP0DY80_9PEZI
MATLNNILRGSLLALPWLAWLFLIDILISLLLPLLPIVPDICYNVSSACAESVWYWIQIIFTRANGAKITVSGDIIPYGESAIVVANHVAWCDFYMIQELAVRAGMLSRCRYFAKTQLRWVPFLGWGLWALGMPLVSRRWDKDKKELDRVFSGIVDRKWPTWLISFSEATRFTPAKYAASMTWCARNDRPQPQHLLYPRTKGFVTTVQHLRKTSNVKAVYDLAIAYTKGEQFRCPPSMWQTLSEPSLTEEKGYCFHVHARRFPLNELPMTDEGLAKWLETCWVEKGEWLEEKRVEWLAHGKKYE